MPLIVGATRAMSAKLCEADTNDVLEPLDHVRAERPILVDEIAIHTEQKARHQSRRKVEAMRQRTLPPFHAPSDQGKRIGSAIIAVAVLVGFALLVAVIQAATYAN